MKSIGHTEWIFVWSRAWSQEHDITDHETEFRACVMNEGGCHELSLEGLLKMFRAKRPVAFRLFAASDESSSELHAMLDEARQGR
jgi:hypothetical protein